MAKIFKCKWSGDASDEYCSNCDGVTMKVDGKDVPCSECAGFEAGDEIEVEDSAETVEEVQEEKVEEKPKKAAEKPVKKEETPVEPTESPKSKEKEASVTNTPAKVEKPNMTEIQGDTATLGDVTLLRYMSGATICHKDTYYKFECCEERKLPEGLTADQVQEEREKLWTKLNAEIDAQIEETLKI